MTQTISRGYIDEIYQSQARRRAIQFELNRLRRLGSQIIEIEGLSSRTHIESLVHLLETAIINPESVDISTLTEYITELTRLINNAGGGIDFLEKFDDAITFYQKRGQSATDLYIAKFRYLTLTSNKGNQFEILSETAQREARTAEEIVKILLVVADYQTAISLYDMATSTCNKCKNIIDDHPDLENYRPAVLTTIGINILTSFEDIGLAKSYLEQGCHLAQYYLPNPQIIRLLATNLHYTARIYELQRQYAQAMHYYIEGQKYQDQCPEELGATAYYHLRLGELLLTAQVPDHALDHLLISRELFRKTRNQGTGDIHIEFAMAAYYVSQSQNAQAEETIVHAIEGSRSRKFIRGELFYLGYLLFFYLKYLRLGRVIWTVIQIGRTLHRDEFEWGNIASIVWRLPLPLSLLFRRLRTQLRRSPPAKKSRASHQLTACLCPLHKQSPT